MLRWRFGGAFRCAPLCFGTSLFRSWLQVCARGAPLALRSRVSELLAPGFSLGRSACASGRFPKHLDAGSGQGFGSGRSAGASESCFGAPWLQGVAQATKTLHFAWEVSTFSKKPCILHGRSELLQKKFAFYLRVVHVMATTPE